MALTAVDFIDLFTDLLEGFLFTGVLTLMFEPKYSKKITTIAYITESLTMFVVIVITTFHKNTMEVDIPKVFVDYVLYISCFFIYCLIFFHGKKIIMFIATIILFVINCISALICVIFEYAVFGILWQQDFSEIQKTVIFRVVLIVAAHIIDVLIFWKLIKITSKKKYFIKQTDFMTFVVIPLMSIILILCCINILEVRNNDIELLIILFIMSLITIAIAIIYGVMFSRISKDNQLKTDYLLTQQKMNLYEESVIKSGKQIEKMSKIKHDIKNYLLSIGNLINDKKYEDAKKLCTEMSDNLQRVYTPVNTENILLNAIVNVELDKAESENIDFKVEILDFLHEFSGNSDIISVIGNICDNAIEYLKTQPREQRIMSLKITKANDYSAIVCKNKISNSVLDNNSALQTSKSDKENHGKGTNIVKEICEKYNGNVSYKEKNNEFIVTVLLKPHQEVTV